jgi:hypothetical protein
MKLRYVKKRDQWESGSGSLVIDAKTFTAEGYCTIGRKWGKYYLINHMERYSYELERFVKEKGIKNIKYVSADLSAKFSYSSLNLVEWNTSFVKKFFPSKLKAFEKKLDMLEAKNKKERKKSKLFLRLRDIKYKTYEGYLKATKEYKKLGGGEVEFFSPSQWIKLLEIGFSWVEIRKNIRTEGTVVDTNDYIELRRKGANKQFLLKVFKGSLVYFHEWVFLIKAGYSKEVKGYIKRPKAYYYTGIDEDFAFITDKQLEAVRKEMIKENDSHYGEFDLIINEIARRKLTDLI